MRPILAMMLLFADAASALLLAPAAASSACHHRVALRMGLLDNIQPLSALKGSIERLTDLRVARASHILLKGFDDATVQQLESFKSEINNDPDKFKEFAMQHSVCPSRAKGGDLDFFTRGKVCTRRGGSPAISPGGGCHHLASSHPPIMLATPCWDLHALLVDARAFSSAGAVSHWRTPLALLALPAVKPRLTACHPCARAPRADGQRV